MPPDPIIKGFDVLKGDEPSLCSRLKRLFIKAL